MGFMMAALQQQIDFIRELDQLKRVHRKLKLRFDNDRFENSAEHSWHITLAAQVLQQYAEENIDISRVTMMLLIHDVVEIDAGDTFAFADQAAQDAQEIAEHQAAERLFGLLPEEQSEQFLTLWHEFERAESPDARFAKAIDRILPLFQNMQNGGGSWREHGVTREQVRKRNDYLQQSAPALWEYACEQI
ncbi:MAG: HD domain-containing protein, partial [Thiolinea sp.]